MANDQGFPPKTALADVTVQFVRDKPPTFDNLPRTQTVSENAANGTIVFTIQGRDDDLQVCHTLFCHQFFFSCIVLCFVLCSRSTSLKTIDIPTQAELENNADSLLINSITKDPGHVLRWMLPKLRFTGYNL